METPILVAIIAAFSALSGSIIGSVVTNFFAMRIAKQNHERQLEIQQIQFNSQITLKARELKFGVYQRRIDEFTQDAKNLGDALAKFGMAARLPDTDEDNKREVFLAFIGVIGQTMGWLVEQLNDLESELKSLGILDKFIPNLEFLKNISRLDIKKITPQEIEKNYQDLSKSLAYLIEIQNALLEKKSAELFDEFLPKKLKP